MKLTPKRRRIVHDPVADRFGVYMWRMPNGAYLADEDRNFLSIAAEYGDQRRIDAIRATATALGYAEGEPVFFAGHRKVSEEEYQTQLFRAKLGLTPDTEDISAVIDDLRFKNARN